MSESKQSTEYDRMLALLGEHQFTTNPFHHPGKAMCACGWQVYVPFDESKELAHRRHLATALAFPPAEETR